jgi:hypothetical protein
MRAKQALDIAQNFNVASFGFLSVSLRNDGDYYLIDGQVRGEALRLLGVRAAPCLLQETPALREEAKAFLGHNVKRNRVIKAETFHAQLTSASPLHLEIQAILAQLGLTVGTKAVEGQRRIACVGTLEQIAKAGQLERVLDFAVHGWTDRYGGLTGLQLQGLRHFITMHKEFERERLLRYMQSTAPQALYQVAKEMQKAFHGGIALNLARALTRGYNMRLVTHKKLPERWLGSEAEDGR